MTEHIEIGKWGRDHWSTLLYLETRCVDYRGQIAIEKMRTDGTIHPQYLHRGRDAHGKYPTILRDGSKVDDHDDWSCVEDMEREGLLKQIGWSRNPRVRLTEKGWECVSQIRQWRASERTLDSFEPKI